MDPPQLDLSFYSSSGWQATREQLLRGVLHDFGNAAAAFRAYADMVRMGDGFEETVMPLYDDEVARLEALLRAAWLLPRRSAPRPEPMAVAALLPDVLALHSRHRELGGVPCRLVLEAEGGAVSMDRTVLAHLALLLVAAAGAGALSGRGGSDGGDGGTEGAEVEVRLTELPDRVILRIGCPGGVPEEWRESVAAARRAAESAGGALREAAGAAALELELPALD